ncbi:phosphomannomutase/phosphoglucomutase [Tropheryma whipplei]|uniref:phosphomannomutase/phosphoglucomutase n=1 Tax=Tropheryma whipplei TaxID=2039 RepID=UPI0006870735|nr:phosphomannomutase/phosphoglucomutase [Tropheryma whipplei]
MPQRGGLCSSIHSYSGRSVSVFKAYDVRGLVPEQLTTDISRAIGAAYIDSLGCSSIVVGRDMRPSSKELFYAFAEGCPARGASVIDIGLCSTDAVYYASGAWNIPAAVFTASHNPPEYNGIKFCRPGAQGIGYTTGLSDVEKISDKYLLKGIPHAETKGKVVKKSVGREYAEYICNLVGPLQKPLKVVIDAGNGMAGKMVPIVMQSALTDIEILPLYFELDGTFPNHEANPFDPKNLVDLQHAVKETGADIGLAFDGDADRCVVIDEMSNPVTPSSIASIVVGRILKQYGNAKATIVHNLLVSRGFAESVISRNSENRLVRTRVGHSFIKDIMHKTNALFGCEHSAHYYFRDFWGADNGMLAALYVMAELCESPMPMSVLSRKYTPYFQSGETNYRVHNPDMTMSAIRQAFPGAYVEFLDGMTLYESVKDPGPERFWWLNVRKSNTEPLLRLNVEAQTEDLMRLVRDKAVKIITGG